MLTRGGEKVRVYFGLLKTFEILIFILYIKLERTLQVF